MQPVDTDVLVVGAGPAGLAVAACLPRRGIEPLVVPSGKIYVLDTDQGSMLDASNSNAPIRIAGEGVKEGVYYRSDDNNRGFFAVKSLSVEANATLAPPISGSIAIPRLKIPIVAPSLGATL